MSHSTGELPDPATAAPNRREYDGDDVAPARPAVRRRSFLWRVWKDPRFDGLRTLLWVGPLTVMIWVYAEREQIKTATLNGVPISVVSGDPNHVVASPNHPTGTWTVNLKVSGPQEAIERVQDQLLHPAPGGPTLRIPLSSRVGVGEQRVQVVPEVLNQQVFRANGLTVDDSQPPELLVDVDQMEEMTLPVALSDDARRRMNLDGPAQFTPATVRVRGPSAALPHDRARSPAVYASLPDDADALLRPGPHDAVPLQLTLPGTAAGEHVSLSDATVTAKYTVRAAERSLLLPRVPVWVLAPPELTHDYDVRDYDVTIPVRVTGPPDQIDQLERNDDPQTRPVAVLTLGREDVNARSKPVEVQRLPPGVHVDTANQRPVSFRLQEIRRAGGDGG